VIHRFARFTDIDHSGAECPATPESTCIAILEDVELIAAWGTVSTCKNDPIALDLEELEQTVLGQRNTASKWSTSELSEAHVPARKCCCQFVEVGRLQ
jgi:hypothetical protein